MSQAVNEMSFSHNKIHFCALHSYWYQVFERFENPFSSESIFFLFVVDRGCLDQDLYTEFRINET